MTDNQNPDDEDDKPETEELDTGDLSLGTHVSPRWSGTPVQKRTYDTKGPHR